MNLDLIKEFEGLRLNAYLDSVGIATIGFGTIKYPTGVKVKMGDVITKAQAEEYLQHDVKSFIRDLNKLLKVTLSENQYSAILSFIYNLGAPNLSKSTLLKKINSNPSDPSIRAEFMKWNKAGGQVITGLTNRRKKEADIYFKNI